MREWYGGDPALHDVNRSLYKKYKIRMTIHRGKKAGIMLMKWGFWIEIKVRWRWMKICKLMKWEKWKIVKEKDLIIDKNLRMKQNIVKVGKIVKIV